MNRLKAKIKTIKNIDKLHFLSFIIKKQNISMLSLEINENIKVGDIVYLTIKSTNIALSKNLPQNISIINKLETKIIDIKDGEILTSIKLDIDGFILESIITTKAYLDMNLHIDDEVIALIKGSEIAIC